MKCLLLVCLVVSAAAGTVADEHHGQYDPNAKLGTVFFPVPSCSANVQKPFERGVALLHSFWYEEADKQFKEVSQLDPHCAMAYWGQAMTLYHELWSLPSAADMKQGAALIARAQSIGAQTARENGFIAALAAYYRNPAASDFEQRAAAYSAGMGTVYQRNPKDTEAATFYSLSLLASEPDNDTAFANRKQAISILSIVFDQQPDHPGAAHYLIHACDNPQFAQQGLTAARKYAAIAPASPHALHMPSHIFARLGLWQEDIQSNLASIAATQHNDTGMHMGAEHQVHAMDFLLYAYLQIGEDEKAHALLEQLKGVRAQDMDAGLEDYLEERQVEMPALYYLELRQWKEALAVQPVGQRPYVQSTAYWAHAVAAGHLHDAAAARQALTQYAAAVEATRKSDKPYRAKYLERNQDEARAWLAFAEGKDREAVTLMRAVAEEQDAKGKGEVELPAREMLADMLRETNHPQQALVEYERAMKTDPNRFNGLAGAARAADLASQPQKASEYSARLLKNCSGSNSNRPELADAKKLMAMNGQ